MSNPHFSFKIYSHTILSAEADDPYSVFSSSGNLVGHFSSVEKAKEAARLSRIKECILELYSLVNIKHG